MAKVVHTSFIQDQMQQKGWSPVYSSDKFVAFQKEGKELQSVPLHPTRTDLVYLLDLQRCFRDLRQEFIDAAFDELPVERMSFDVLIAKGHTDDTDIRNLLDALSDLNCALGGSGITFEQVEAVTA